MDKTNKTMKSKLIYRLRAALYLTIATAIVVAVVAILGSAVAYITGWGLVRGSLAVALLALLSTGTQVVMYAIHEAKY